MTSEVTPAAGRFGGETMITGGYRRLTGPAAASPAERDGMHLLGRTGLLASRIGLGAMMFGSYGEMTPQDATKLVHRALDAGVNLIDTADGYCGGESEENVGAALKGKRDQVVLCTKVGMPTGGDVNARGGSRRWITREVEASLRRLGTDRIDLYQLHSFDDLTPIEETLATLSDLVAQGKIIYAGASNFPAERIVEAQWASRARGLVRFVTEQLQYSLLDRRAETALLPTCARHGVGVLLWGPLNGGWLTGKYLTATQRPTSGPRYERVRDHYDPDAPGNRDKADRVAQLVALAREAGMTPVELALRFCVSHQAVSTAIVGPKTMAELDEALPALTGTLNADVLDAIDRIVAPGSKVGVDHQTPSDWLQVPQMRRHC